MYSIQKQNLYDLMINKKGNKYIVYIKNNNQYKPLTIKLENVKLLFGIETYAKKYILNLCMNNDNEGKNNYATIAQIDSFIKNLIDPEFNKDCKNLCASFKKDITSRHYKSCLREKHGSDPLLRTHIKMKQNTVQTLFTKDEKHHNPRKLRYKKCDVVLEFKDIWKTQYNYGFTIFVKSLNVVGTFEPEDYEEQY